jgi:hypothetical protein
MKRNFAWFVAGVLLATTASIGLAAPNTDSGQLREITLRDGDTVRMPALRWECTYARGVSVFSPAPPGPLLHCGRLGAWTGGIRTHTDLYYVVVRRGTNADPKILYRGRRP